MPPRSLARTSLAASPAATSTRRAKLNRGDKAKKIHASLFHAAAKVVGEVGYMNAMVSTITARAGVAQGTFYNYFETRQELFDQLLPNLGHELLEFIKEEAAGATNALEREERGFRAFFVFLKLNPEFYRILYEAEVFAPAAFRLHMETVCKGYVRVLDRALAAGEIHPCDRRDLEAFANILMGARHYLCMRYARSDGGIASVPEWVVRAYMNVVQGGLYKSQAELRAAKHKRAHA